MNDFNISPVSHDVLADVAYRPDPVVARTLKNSVLPNCHAQCAQSEPQTCTDHPIAQRCQRDNALSNHPFYALSQAAFRFYLHPGSPYPPQLEGYYQNIQRGFLEKFRRRVPPAQHHNVRYLFAASYVTGAGQGAAVSQAPPVDLPEMRQAKTEICTSLTQHPDTKFVMAYLGEKQDHPNHRRNAGLIARHELDWMCRLAQQEGGKQAEDRARRAKNQLAH